MLILQSISARNSCFYKGVDLSFSYFNLFCFFLLPIIVGLSFLWLVYKFTVLRKKKINRLLLLANNEDKLWDEERLKNYTKEIYKVIQLSLNQQNEALLRNIVSDYFFDIITKQFQRIQTNGDILQLLNQLNVEVEIIGLQNYKTDNWDKYSALIIVNNNKEVIYHFIRVDNMWLLDWIQLDISFNGQTKPIIYHET